MRRPTTTLIAIYVFAAALHGYAVADEKVPAEPSTRWWKGNLHTHSLWSDGNDFPEMIAEWYRTRGYNFLALSDHNVLSRGRRWMKHSAIISRGGKDALEKYRARFGGGWVETRGDADSLEVRLKPLDEFRALVEERGQFLMIEGEEISDRAEGRPVHMNATNLRDVIPPAGGETIAETLANNQRAVAQQARLLGREILLHLNHPNFGYAITAEEMAAVTTERFYEVYNGHPAVGHLGNDNHPGVERLWDVANTIRVSRLNAAPMYGVATDDSHTYHGVRNVRPGRGWIMVRSRYLTPEHIIRAVNKGDFYSSSGVTLDELTWDEDSQTLRLRIKPRPGVEYTTRFIGTPANYDRTSTPRTDAKGKPVRSTRKYSEDVGKDFATVKGTQAEYRLTGEELYIRAVVTSTQQHPDPSFTGQVEQAWTQPVGWTLEAAD